MQDALADSLINRLVSLRQEHVHRTEIGLGLWQAQVEVCESFDDLHNMGREYSSCLPAEGKTPESTAGRDPTPEHGLRRAPSLSSWEHLL